MANTVCEIGLQLDCNQQYYNQQMYTLLIIIVTFRRNYCYRVVIISYIIQL